MAQKLDLTESAKLTTGAKNYCPNLDTVVSREIGGGERRKEGVRLATT